MTSRTEAERLALAVHDLRADWPVSQLVTLIGELQTWPYRDLATALVWVALDETWDGKPASKSPYRVKEQGPWRTITTVNAQADDERRDADNDRAMRIENHQAVLVDNRHCRLCDELGYRGGHRCDHNPDTAAIAAVGAAAARAAIRPVRSTQSTEGVPA